MQAPASTLVIFILAAALVPLSMGGSCTPTVYYEGEPNDTPPEADANNTWNFSQAMATQARGGLTPGSDESDIWILRTLQADNDIKVSIGASPAWPDDPDEACVFVEVAKCTQAGVADWASCPSNKRVDEFTIWNCEPFGVPPSPEGSFTIGQDKLFKLKLVPDPFLPPGGFADTSYTAVLRQNP